MHIDLEILQAELELETLLAAGFTYTWEELQRFMQTYYPMFKNYDTYFLYEVPGGLYVRAEPGRAAYGYSGTTVGASCTFQTERQLKAFIDDAMRRPERLRIEDYHGNDAYARPTPLPRYARVNKTQGPPRPKGQRPLF